MDDPFGSNRPTRLALVAGFVTLYLVWGSTYLGIKLAVETLPPLLMAGSRFLLAGILLYVILRVRGMPAPAWRQWRPATLTGALLLLGGNGLVTWGQQMMPTGRSALLVATTPLWMVVMGWVFYAGDRPRLRVWLGLASGFVGAALLMRQPADAAEGSLTGAIVLALSPICWSIGSLQTRRSPPAADPLMTSAMQMLTGGALMILLGSCLGEWPLLWTRDVSATSVLAFFYLALIGGLVGFTTYAWLLRHASPSAVSTYAYVNPLVAVLLGWLAVGEEVGPTIVVAAVLVLGAVVLITWPSKPKPAATQVPREPSLLTKLRLLTGRRCQPCEKGAR